MFETINKVNWKSLKQANGSSEYIPSALNSLVSNDIEQQQKAYWMLDNHIVLQGDLYESAFYIIPFLIEIVNSKELSDTSRNHTYNLLFEILNGYSPDEVKVKYNGIEYSLNNACKNIIADNFLIFLEDVKNSNSGCRQNALDLLVSIEGKESQIISHLDSIINSENKSNFLLEIDNAIEEIKLKI